MPPATPRYARIKLSRTRRSSVGSLARICSIVGSGLDPGRTSTTALPSTDSRLALWQGGQGCLQGADASWCVVAPASSAIECRPRRLRGTNLGDAATDREDRLVTSQRSANGPNCSWACSLACLRDRRWLVGQTAQLDLRRPLRYGNCTDSTLGCWMAKKRSVLTTATEVVRYADKWLEGREQFCEPCPERPMIV